VFESRTKAFKDDEVLQENIIVHMERGVTQGAVTISMSQDQSFGDYSERELPFSEIVKNNDPERFIHIPTLQINGSPQLFSHSLEELGLWVSTGPVVDFRVKDYWLKEPTNNCVPLLYAHHFKGGDFNWPKEHKKPNALSLNGETRKWLMPRGYYTITKRFSAKEEKRRLVAFVVDPERIPHDLYGFENHLNVFHTSKKDCPPTSHTVLHCFLIPPLSTSISVVSAGILRSMRQTFAQCVIRAREISYGLANGRKNRSD
jgi:adenine-specific DNA-methyltransferase